MDIETAVGLYDPMGRVTELVINRTSLAISISRHHPVARGPEAQAAYLIDKDLLLSRSTHLIVAMDDLESFSILIGGVRRLLEGSIKAVMAIGEAPLELLQQATAQDGQAGLLARKMTEKKFIVVKELTPEDLDAFMAA